jgi:hypothetical protein
MDVHTSNLPNVIPTFQMGKPRLREMGSHGLYEAQLALDPALSNPNLPLPSC